MVRTARKLKEEKGILAVPEKKRGKILSPEVVTAVQNFYEDDEFSRMCPGIRDFVSIRIDGKKVQKQKRLLLNNLKEMYTAHKNKNSPEIGFSKFCELRPQWCVTVDAPGSHRVCVCTIHQNVKLMLLGANIGINYRTLLEKTVCNLEAKDCMLHKCELCPGGKAVEDYLSTIFAETGTDAEDSIEFKQWVYSDRENLITIKCSIEDFKSELT